MWDALLFIFLAPLALIGGVLVAGVGVPFALASVGVVVMLICEAIEDAVRWCKAKARKAWA